MSRIHLKLFLETAIKLQKKRNKAGGRLTKYRESVFADKLEVFWKKMTSGEQKVAEEGAVTIYANRER